MKKLLIGIILLFLFPSLGFGSENNIEDNLSVIKTTIQRERQTLNYIDVQAKTINPIPKGILNVQISIKNFKSEIIDYNGHINIKTLFFGESFNFGKIPSQIEIIKGIGNINIEVIGNIQKWEKSEIEKSGLVLILNSQKKDVFGNIYAFSYGGQFININDYIYELKVDNINNNPILLEEKSFLNIASKIASPKDINKNPFMIGFNFLLAFLYLITFYFTAQIFNSYFEKVVEKQNINKKLSDISIFIFELPFIKLNNFFKKIFEKRKYQKLLNINQKVANFFNKNEHKIYVFLGLLALGIIGQITVDDFDVLSLKGLFTIFLMIFVLGLITFFKDFVLYFLNKGKEKEKLKIENIPIGFILATIVTSTGRIVGLEPNMLFGNVLRIHTKDNQVEKKLSSSKLLFKVLVITFLVGLIFWFLTVLFSPNSFFYKFFIIAYFGIVNDVFFALLPFGLLWGTFILKDKKMKWKWFIFSFIVLGFLLHTILNPEGDLQKILDFDGNIFILAGFLIFWIVITCITYFYIKQNERKIAE